MHACLRQSLRASFHGNRV